MYSLTTFLKNLNTHFKGRGFMGKMKGSEAIIQCLLEEGVKTIFGFPGGAVIDLYDDLMDSEVNHVLVRHEQALFMRLMVLPA